MNIKFDELSTRIKTIDMNAQATESLAKQNKNNISNLKVNQQLFKKNYQNKRRKYVSLRRTMKTRLTDILETHSEEV